MGSESEPLVRWLALAVALATTASCGIFPGREFGGSLGNANDSSDSGDNGDSDGTSTGGDGSGNGNGGSGDSGGTAEGDASPVNAGAPDSDAESAPDGAVEPGKGSEAAGGSGSAIQIRSGAFTGLAGPGPSVGPVRVLGQFTPYGASSMQSASGIVVLGGFQ